MKLGSQKPFPGDKRPDSAEKRDHKSRIEEDLALIEMVTAGSTAHWHTFVDRYAGLIYSVVRRQLYIEDEDDIRTVFADILETLYRGKLEEFRGRSELSTWLIVVSRGKALDFLRRRDGRRRAPQGYDDLSEFDRDVLRLHYAEGLNFEAITHTLAARGDTVDAEKIAHAILKIESTLDHGYLRRLLADAKAPAMGIMSGRLLDFLTKTHIELELPRGDRPDEVLERKSLEDTAERVWDLLSELSDDERSVVRLRYQEGWTARRISDHMGLGGQRRVYTMLDGAIRKLRNLLKQ